MERKGKGEKLSEAMTHIDEKFTDAETIEKATARMRKKNRTVRIIALASAAALVLCAIPAGVFMALRNLGEDIIGEITTPDPIVFDGGAYTTGDSDLPEALSTVNVSAEGCDSKIIPVSGSFLITTASKTDVETLTEYISISPKTDMGVVQLSDTEFKVTPASGELTPGTVYRVTVGDPDNPSASYAFQTETKLCVKSILPTDLATNVPVNTGIEVTFSDSVSGTDYANYIKISPEVKGSFKLYPDGRTVAFVPKNNLEYDTIYTVTVEAGLGGISGKKLETGVNSAFRTVTKTYETTENGGLTSTLGIYVDTYTTQIFSPGLEASVSYNVTGYNILSYGDVTAKLYAFDSVEAAADAIVEAQKNLSSGDGTSYDTSKLKYIGTYKGKVTNSYSSYYSNGCISFGNTLSTGIYLVEFTANATGKTLSHLTAVKYSFIQISNLRPYTVSSDGKTVLWVNTDSGDPAVGLTVGGTAFNRTLGWDVTTDSFKKTEAKSTDENGLTEFSADCNSAVICVTKHSVFTASKDTIKEGDGVVICASLEGEESENYYMKSIYTDRETYFSSDTVNFSGFIVNSYTGEIPAKLYLQTGNSVIKTPVNIKADGSFTGSYTYEDMGEGGLYLKFTDADGNVLISKYVSITEEEKPQVTASLSFDKAFYRRGEAGTLTLTASFFDGTPVEGLSFLICIGGHKTGEVRKTSVTDENGQIQMHFTTGQISASSTSPEYIYASAELVNFETQSLYINEEVPYFHSEYIYGRSYSGDSRKLTLAYRDFGAYEGLGTISYSLYNAARTDKYPEGKVSWTLKKYVITKTLATSYDSYTKLTSHYWKYSRSEYTVDSGTYSFKDGVIDLALYEVSGFTGGYYYEISFYDDTSENTYTGTVNATKNTRDYESTGDSDNTRELVLNRDTYTVGDSIEAKYLVDGELTRSLFVICADGIEKYCVGDSIEAVYAKSMIPGATVYAVQYDSKTDEFNESYEPIEYNYSECASLDVTLSTDKESYKPGETAKVKVHADGVGGASVVLSIVDEACFALEEQEAEILSFFTSNGNSVDSGYYYSYMYGYYYGNNYGDCKPVILNGRFSTEEAPDYSYRYGLYYKGESVASMNMTADAAESATESAAGSASYYVRKYFADNPEFSVIYLDKNGDGYFTFTVPDNITSWRITALAASGLGTGIENMKLGCTATDTVCTQPFFLNISSCTSYIVGDTISMAARAYGTGADGKVAYKAVLTSLDGTVIAETTASADSKTRAWLKFGSLEAGQYKVTVYGKCGEYTDAVETDVQVIESAVVTDVRRTVSAEEIASINAKYYPVVLSFYNPTAAGVLYDSIASRLSYGDSSGRSDMLAAQYVALTVSEKLYGTESSEDLAALKELINSRTSPYVSLLDYSAADIALTSQILALYPELITQANREEIMQDCYDYLASSEVESAEELCEVLVCLAALGEPVLDRLYAVSAYANGYSDEAKLYLALAFACAGDWSAANSIYNQIKEAYAVTDSDYGTLYLKQNTLEESIKLISLALLITCRTNRTDAEAQAKYLCENLSSYESATLALASYLRYFLPTEKVPDRSFEYKVGDVTEKITLASGKIYTISLNKAELKSFEMLSIDEGVKIRAAYRGSPSDEAIDSTDGEPRVSISKSFEYTRNGMYRVTLKISGTSTRVCESFSLYDTIPSGARFVVTETSGYGSNCSGSVYTYAGIWNRSGQSMTGYVHIYNEAYSSSERYRTACPEYSFSVSVSYTIRGAVEGTFIAEPAFIRLPVTRTLIVSESYSVDIKENGKWSIKTK